jgi:hypothetical protein
LFELFADVVKVVPLVTQPKDIGEHAQRDVVVWRILQKLRGEIVTARDALSGDDAQRLVEGVVVLRAGTQQPRNQQFAFAPRQVQLCGQPTRSDVILLSGLLQKRDG